MARRKIINIDEDKCNGCGLCIPNCKEGALKIVNGKARLVSEVFCDGLGACLGHCPQGAITIEERDAQAFDEKKVAEHLNKEKLPCGCPGSMVMDMRKEKVDSGARVKAQGAREESQLRQWPVQIMLVPPNAPYFKGADLLIAADCVPFAYPGFHSRFLRGKIVLVGCPKLDNIEVYKEKILAIIKDNDIRSVTHVHMEVPCCFGLVGIIEDAIARAKKKVPFEDVTITIKGDVK
jgi:ferredoxin